MLKTAEMLPDRFLREDTLVRYPLQESQHAYQAGKLMKTALYSLATKIESSMQEKQYAIVVFVDIEGEFDSTTFAVIQDALERHNVGKTMIKLIVNMLSRRSVHLTYQSCSADAKVVKGCPQRGELPPLQ